MTWQCKLSPLTLNSCTWTPSSYKLKTNEFARFVEGTLAHAALVPSVTMPGRALYSLCATVLVACTSVVHASIILQVGAATRGRVDQLVSCPSG